MYKERISKLMNAVKDTEYGDEDLEFIESRMNTFTDYVGHVAQMEIIMQRLRIQGVDGQEWRDKAQDLDATRRIRHDCAMDAINQLNRMCKANGVEPFYDGVVDHDHRTDVGDVIGDIVNEYFQTRDGRELKQEDLMGKKLTREDLMDDFTEAVENIPTENSEMEK